jgi:hypothetical protein
MSISRNGVDGGCIGGSGGGSGDGGGDSIKEYNKF